jgi:hypothetical protein
MLRIRHAQQRLSQVIDSGNIEREQPNGLLLCPAQRFWAFD